MDCFFVVRATGFVTLGGDAGSKVGGVGSFLCDGQDCTGTAAAAATREAVFCVDVHAGSPGKIRGSKGRQEYQPNTALKLLFRIGKE